MTCTYTYTYTVEGLSQLCVLVGQVSLAVGQSSLAVGQLSATVSQLAAVVGQYVLVVGQLGGLVLQAGAALRRLSDSVSTFSGDLQRFSVVMVQCGVGFRHVSVTARHLAKAVAVFVAASRDGDLPWTKVFLVVRQCSEAVCGLGVALGEVGAVLGLLTALNARLASVSRWQGMSRGSVTAVLHLAARARRVSVTVAQLSGAIYQLSVACRHLSLVAQQWALVINSVSSPWNLLKSVFITMGKYLQCLCINKLTTLITLFTTFVHRLMRKIDNILMEYGVTKKTNTSLTPLPAGAGLVERDPVIILVRGVQANRFSYVTLHCPKEFFSVSGNLWKNRKREGETVWDWWRPRGGSVLFVYEYTGPSPSWSVQRLGEGVLAVRVLYGECSVVLDGLLVGEERCLFEDRSAEDPVGDPRPRPCCVFVNVRAADLECPECYTVSPYSHVRLDFVCFN